MKPPPPQVKPPVQPPKVQPPVTPVKAPPTSSSALNTTTSSPATGVTGTDSGQKTATPKQEQPAPEKYKNIEFLKEDLFKDDSEDNEDEEDDDVNMEDMFL